MNKILLIDDIDQARQTIGEMLTRGGYEVIEASNGHEGIKSFQEHYPDLVITDIVMPEMEGLETIKRLREINPHVPIIAMTASNYSTYMTAALKLGAFSGIFKPFQQKEILTEVQKALKWSKNI